MKLAEIGRLPTFQLGFRENIITWGKYTYFPTFNHLNNRNLARNIKYFHSRTRSRNFYYWGLGILKVR